MRQRLAGWYDRLPTRVIAGLFLAPFVYGILKSFFQPAPWFTDFKAVACAGNAVIQARSIYDTARNCPLSYPQPYVYTPLGADIFAFLQRVFGIFGESFLFGVLYCAVLAVVFRRLLRDEGQLRQRAPFLAGMSATALHSGNVSIVIHGAIFLLATSLPTAPILLLPLIVVAGAIKPTFGVYSCLFLFTNRPLQERILLTIVSVAAIAAYLGAFARYDAADFAQWTQLARVLGLNFERGHGIIALPFIERLADGPSLGLLYLAIAIALLGSALTASRNWLSDPADRLSLGISVCILLYPRIMDYDQYTLPFGLAALVAARLRAGVPGASALSALVLVGCLLGIVIGGRRGGECLFFVASFLIVALGIPGVRTAPASAPSVVEPVV
jgi:hypothetical protein